MSDPSLDELRERIIKDAPAAPDPIRFSDRALYLSLNEKHTELLAAFHRSLLLLEEIHEWTKHKETPCAREVKKLLEKRAHIIS